MRELDILLGLVEQLVPELANRVGSTPVPEEKSGVFAVGVSSRAAETAPTRAWVRALARLLTRLG